MRIVESYVVVRNSSLYLKDVFAGYRILGSLPLPPAPAAVI